MRENRGGVSYSSPCECPWAFGPELCLTIFSTPKYEYTPALDLIILLILFCLLLINNLYKLIKGLNMKTIPAIIPHFDFSPC
jgi:hypothetical protein